MPTTCGRTDSLVVPGLPQCRRADAVLDADLVARIDRDVVAFAERSFILPWHHRR